MSQHRKRRGMESQRIVADYLRANGHDLTVPHAFVFSASGLRSCRLCSEATGNRRKRPIKDIGSINRWTG